MTKKRYYLIKTKCTSPGGVQFIILKLLYKILQHEIYFCTLLFNKLLPLSDDT